MGPRPALIREGILVGDKSPRKEKRSRSRKKGKVLTGGELASVPTITRRVKGNGKNQNG
jgi:hypothetical protein